MPAGSVQYVIECQVRTTGVGSVAPCTTVGTTRYQPVMVQRYVLDPANASLWDAVAIPVNYADLGALWAFGFSMTVGLWFLAKNIGVVVNAIRRF